MKIRTFEITKTVEDEDVASAEEAIRAALEDIKEGIPGAVVSEITIEPAPEGQTCRLRVSEVLIN